MKASKAQFHRFLKSFSEMMKREKRYRWILVLSVVLFFLTLALPLWKILPTASLKPFIPLHYNVLFGIDRFGPWWHIFWIPVFSFLALVVNFTIGSAFYLQEKLMTTLLVLGSFVVQLVLLCAMTFIVLVNL